MRHFLALGLSLCVVGSAAAQTEVIIRRPGQKDEVIRLDSTRTREMAGRLEAELKTQARHLQNSVQLMERNLQRRANFDTMPMKLALRGADLAAAASRDQVMTLEQNLGKVRMALRQPHIGVGIDTRPRDSDKYGAYIQSVTPGSPAEKAGIMSGDIITRFAGKSLTEKSREDGEDTTPGLRLISIITSLPVGKPVEVDLRRGTQNRSVKVTPVEDESVAVSRLLPEFSGWKSLAVPGEGYGQAVTAPMAAARSFNMFGNGGSYFYSFGGNGLFANLELAPVNEKLGSYFGTSEGVLVISTNAEGGGIARALELDLGNRAFSGTVRVDTVTRGAIARGSRVRTEDSTGDAGVTRERRAKINTLGLEPGDVIVSIDGRKVTTPSQLMRIVSTYDRGEEFKLQIMRQKRAESLAAKMP